MLSTSNRLFNETWPKLLKYMETMFKFESISRDDYMDFFRTVHNYFTCTEYQDIFLIASSKPKIVKKADENAKKPDENSKKPEPDENNTDLPCGEMYFSLKNYIQDYLKEKAEKGTNLQAEDFLRFYAKTWENYQFLCKTMNNLFSTLNSNWVHRQHENKITYVSKVFTMSMQIWQETFFKDSNQSLAQTCLNLIKNERDGQRIEPLLIRQVVQSYVYAGSTDTEKANETGRKSLLTLSMYKNYFEKQFLQDTEQFYRLESDNYLADNSVLDYMKKVTKRIEEEERRVKECLHETTLNDLGHLVEEILIKRHLESIYGEFDALLSSERIEDLRILFKLVNRIKDANKPLQIVFEGYVYKNGVDAINRVSAAAFKDPKVYVEIILEVYNRFYGIVKEAFCCEQGYVAALDRAFSKFVNNNAVTQAAGKSTKSPELLARYCDTLLRKGNKGAEESDVEEKISQIMVVFNYVEDKDVFQKFYGKLLAKRLVSQLSASDDYEATMISKLKAACGYEYASKLERMFQDISISTSLIGEYKTYCDNKRITDIVDFSVMVLTSNSWPFSAPLQFSLPHELKRTSESFTNFYKTKYTGRKLEWLHQHSKGELAGRYNKSKYTFQVSTYQMAILLLFNDSPYMTVEKILDGTQIESNLFVSILATLLKSKVLTCAEIDADKIDGDLKDSDIKINYTIQVDENFKSKKVKINLNLPMKSVEQKDADNINQSVDEERKILIQAAIVRIMKARKTLKHTALIQEVIPQLTARFQPQIPTIKKCIDLLIDKDYLTREPNERDLYHYVA